MAGCSDVCAKMKFVSQSNKGSTPELGYAFQSWQTSKSQGTTQYYLPTGLAFVKVLLVFETTGAMGKETQKWWDSIKTRDKDLHEFGPQSRRANGLTHTWNANSFATFWQQSIAVAHARAQAESISQRIGVCQQA